MTRSACLNSLYDIAKRDERVVFIGSDLSPNTLLDFKRDFPDRFFMEGVQEQNIIGMAAGLALEGYIPYVNTIATFLTRRCYEQVVIDICAHNLPVRLIGNGGGLVYTPLGPTHTAIDDIAIMRSIPNMSVVCCSDNGEMKAFMPTTLNYPGPIYIRLGKDSDPISRGAPIEKNRDNLLLWLGSNITIISTGIMTWRALKIAHEIKANVYHISHIKPLDRRFVKYCAKGDWLKSDGWHKDKNVKLIVAMEEGIINGGLGSAILEHLSDNNIQIPVLRFGLPDAFPHHYGEQEDLLETYGLTPEKMAVRIKEFYESL